MNLYRRQPIVDLFSGQAFVYEMLWNGHGPTPKWEYQDRELLRHHLNPGDRVSVNLTSAGVLHVEDILVERAANLVGRLVVEWREDWHGVNASRAAAAKLRNWRDRFGILLAIDDAGTGHCCLEKFILSEPDIVKLDGRLVQSAAAGDFLHLAACRLIVDFSMRHGAEVVGEWIQTKEHLDFAKSLGIQYGQGFYLDSLLSHRGSSSLCQKAGAG